MRIKDIAALRIDINEIEVDITPIIEQKYFESKTCKNFREDSVNFFIYKKINFHSTSNNFLILMKRFVKIICPNCKREIQQEGYGGSPSLYTIIYKCNNCSTVLNLVVNPNEIISINFDKSNNSVKEKSREEYNEKDTYSSV